MIFYKTDEQIELIKQSCLLVSKTLGYVGSLLKEGISGDYLDREAEQFIRQHGGIPGFKGYGDFPASLCISRNDVVVHGIPDKKPFENGDLVSIDCGVFMNGYYGDAAFTFAIGEISEEAQKLIDVTRECLNLGIEQAKIGNRIGDIGYVIQNHARSHGYGVVEELVGHGIGKSLHEAPEVPNFGKRGRGKLIQEGLTIAIEPMINMGTKRVQQDSDGWTIRTRDRKQSAHYEHTIAVTKNGPVRLSTHDYPYDAIKNNENLKQLSQKS